LGPLTADDGIEVVVIAGLGGRSVVRILEMAREGLARLRRLVLQPQTGVARVRRWLAGGGFGIVAEQVARERRRFYFALAAEPAPGADPEHHSRLDPEDLLEAGPALILSADPLLTQYWQAQLRRQERILRRARPGSGLEKAAGRRALALRILAALGADPSASPQLRRERR
jgi:tRNA (adenine22-N1)-methyltransferase